MASYDLGGKRVLVTGGAGFIGSHLVDRLIEKGSRVTVIDNFDDFYEGKEGNIEAHLKDGNYRLIRGDILDYDLVLRATKGVDAIFHEAAQAGIRYCNLNPVKAHRVNVEGTLNVMMACKENAVKRVVYASSSSIFGNPRYVPIDEACPTNPNSPYGATKLAGEHYCSVFHEVYGLPVVCLRYFSVYGPRGRPDQVIYSMGRSMMRGESPIIYGDGSQRRDFTYVSDVVGATILAAEIESIDGEVFNIGYGRDFSIKELFDLTAKALQDKAVDIAPRYVERYRGDFQRTLADNSKARKKLGWKPSVNLEEGLREYMRWLRDRYKQA